MEGFETEIIIDIKNAKDITSAGNIPNFI